MMPSTGSRTARIVGVVLTGLLLSLAPALQAQQTGTVTGRVTEGQSGQPIASVQVFITGLDIGVLTQQNGRFLLQNVPAGTHTVTAERIGYNTVTAEVTVGAGETVVQNFSLVEEALQLDEVVVTGTPGGTQRRALGNTVAQVEAAQLTQNVSITNMQDLLTARTPGLRFNVLNGNVGTGSGMTIRGVGSFSQSRSQPLIFVDGVRVNNDIDAGPTLGEGAQVNVLNDFNPEDIESVEIIKGPAAASLYGTEASAGVIQIITKRGQEGAPEFNLSVRQGVNYMSDPAGRLGTFWFCPTNPSPGFEDHDEDPGTPPLGCDEESELERYNMYEEGTRYIQEGYFDWPSDNLYQYGHNQGYNLSVRGGTESIRYFLSGNYDSEEGITWYNTNEAFRLRGNVGVVFSDQLTLDVSTGYTDGDTRFAQATVGDGGIWQDLVWSNGYYLDRNTPFDGSADNRAEPANPRLGGFQEHLPTDVADIEATRDYSRFTGSATLTFNSGEFDLAGLSTNVTNRLVVGIDKGWEVNRQLFPLEDGVVPDHLQQYTDTWESRYSETEDGTMVYERPINTNVSFDYAFTVDAAPNDTWSTATSFGAQYYVDQNDVFSNNGSGFASTLSTTINQLAQSRVLTDYELIENKSLGFYVQEEIGYEDRIFVTGAIRFDDNSTFGTETPAERYPKVSATWVISEESFWNIDPINSLRLRGAWGKAGRQPASTANQNIYVAIPGPGGASAIRPSSPGNPQIEPEVSTEIELGFDAAFLDDRISGEFTYYSRTDEQALLEVPITPSFGFPGSVDQNLGQIDNWGWEALLSARVFSNDALAFDLDLSADNTDNEIKSLGDYGANATIAVGLPYPNNHVDNWVVSGQQDDAGAFVNAYGERYSAMCDSGVPSAESNGSLLPGGEPMPCQDIVDREIYAGRGFATHTFSVSPRLTLLDGALQLFALAEGQYGRVSQDDGHNWGHNYNNSKDAILENDPVWFVSTDLNGTDDSWEKSLFDADFWKLREVGARYTLPESFVGRLGVERAAFNVSARNIWTIWQAQDEIYGHPVSDPEFGDPTSLGGDGNFYSLPGISSVNATLRVTF